MNMMLAGAMAAAGRAGRQAADDQTCHRHRCCCARRWSHVSAYMQVLLMFMIGGRVVRSDRADICQLIAITRSRPSPGYLTRRIAMLLAATSGLGPYGPSRWRGAACLRSCAATLRENLPGLGVGSGYGLTETNGLVSAISNSELDSRPLAVGPVLPTVECRILGKDGEACSAGESGQISLRGAMLMKGYCNAPRHATPDDRSYWWLVQHRRHRLISPMMAICMCWISQTASWRTGGNASPAATSRMRAGGPGHHGYRGGLHSNGANDGLMIVVAAPDSEDFSHVKDLLSRPVSRGPDPASAVRGEKAAAPHLLRQDRLCQPAGGRHLAAMPDVPEPDRPDCGRGAPGERRTRAGGWRGKAARRAISRPPARPRPARYAGHTEARFDVSCLMKFFPVGHCREAGDAGQARPASPD